MRRAAQGMILCAAAAGALTEWNGPPLNAAEPVDKLPAFPAAEGFGAHTPGGRGGRVIKVTNLNAEGPGSLQAACSARGPRMIVFHVSGVIEGGVTIEHGNVTIAGQTAPGAGITIRGMLSVEARPRNPVGDVVVRFLRVRMPPGGGNQSDALRFSVVKRAVIDHVSCSWAEDETVDLYTRATDVTLQWCTIEESSVRGHPEGRHNYGLIAGPRSKRLSIHHNLFAHHARRNPAVGGGPVDFRNNVVYDFRDGFSHEGNYPGTPGFNIVGNYYKRGPSDPKIFPFCFGKNVPYYLRENDIHGVGTVQDPWAEADKLPGLRYYADRGRRQTEPAPVPQVATHKPRHAYELVLGKAGCFPRDAVTRRIVAETRRGTGRWGKRTPENLMAGLTPEAPAPDRDGDGMPDAWERAMNLDPADGTDHQTRLPSGYTAIETFCHHMAAWRVAESPGGGPPAADLRSVRNR